jgi:hypothetical protein
MTLPIRRSIAVLLVSTFLCGVCRGQKSVAASPIVVDASRPMPAPAPADFHGGTAINPRSKTIGLNERYLTLDGQPWLPVMGEFHYTRVPRKEWEEEILKMKAAGVDIIATYVIWIHHEETEGHFDWSDERDLRSFVELCARHNMLVYPRIGPWAHGEVRNGGFPDWLLKKSAKTRSNDPVFLSYAKTWYDQIGEQLKGLLWKDGGPIIGIQMENEYSMRGPDQGEAYILRLKEMAIAAGLDVPIYSVTGWDNAVIPKQQAVAVFGGYPDAPWDSSTHRLPPGEVYAFRFGSRVSGNMGAIGPAGDSTPSSSYGFPFMTAEMGGGVQDTYHRRPVIRPDDVAAMVPVMLGSGVNLYGTYMFQGGMNPDGKLSTLQESQATGYPTDVPVKSYDFQAPLSEFGEERDVLRKLKVFHYFLHDFGNWLAPMAVFAPALLPGNPQDLSVARVSVRTNGEGGFLFFNNYVRDYAMPVRPGFQVRIKLPAQELRLPDKPVDLPSGVYGIWPFGLQLGSMHLRYATAQLFSRTEDASGEIFYFIATRGVAPQFAFDMDPRSRLDTRGRQEKQDGGLIVTDLQPALEPAITATDPTGRTTTIVLLDPEQAEEAWKLNTGAGHLLITRAQYFSEGGKVTLQSDDPHFEFTVIPPVEPPGAGTVSLRTREGGKLISRFSADLPHIAPKLEIRQIKNARQVPPAKLGPSFAWRPQSVPMAPDDKDFANAAMWKLTIPTSAWGGVNKLFLQIQYDGDVARLISAGRLLDDNFYNGEPWRVGLNRFREQITTNGLALEILPRRADSTVYLEERFRSPGLQSGQVDRLESAKPVPLYSATFTFGSEKYTQPSRASWLHASSRFLISCDCPVCQRDGPSRQGVELLPSSGHQFTDTTNLHSSKIVR